MEEPSCPNPLLTRRTVTALGCAAALGPWLPASAKRPGPDTDAPTGTFLRPFAADSLWNSRPVDAVLGDFVIPKSSYFPMIGEGAWSTGVFRARPDDAPMTVQGPRGKRGVWDPDAEAFRDTVTLPHWPADVQPAQAADGHADIVDEAAGVIHSFWQLKPDDDGTWRATQYAWTRLDGRGFGDPAHYFQGARAAGVPTMAGLMRRHEVNDGDSQFHHALAVSLTFNALSPKPAYTFPATSADYGAESQNTGRLPEGTLLMLPPGFDLGTLRNAQIRKVAQTLQTYGGYVVDRNVGTPFVIYVENGSGYSLHPPKGWNNNAAFELEVLRQALRPLVSAGGWVDANGRRFQPHQRLNLLSLRGNWQCRAGDGSAVFDTWRQAVVLQGGSADAEFACVNGHNVSTVAWAKPDKGLPCRLTVRATGGARLRLEVVHGPTGKVAYTSRDLADGAVREFDWPTPQYLTNLVVQAPAGRTCEVGATLLAQA